MEGVETHDHSSSTRETEAGKIVARPGYVVRTYLKKKKKKEEKGRPGMERGRVGSLERRNTFP